MHYFCRCIIATKTSHMITNPALKYIIRAVKYFLYIVVLLSLFIGVLVLLKMVDPDVSKMFRNGYKSLWQIAAMFGIVSGIYPLFGYIRRGVIMRGEYKDVAPIVKDVMSLRGYEQETEQGEDMTFRSRNMFSRIMKVFEDRISFTRTINGFYVEGLRRDVIPLLYALESRVRSEEQDGQASD